MSLGNITQQDEFAQAVPEYLLKLDIACGNVKKQGFTGIDISSSTSADIIYDLDIYPWPFDDSSVYEIYCSHFIEHTKDIKKFMEECYRILGPAGLMTIIAPYYSHQRAIQDFTHKRFIGEETFKYFNKQWLTEANLTHYNVNCDFEIVHIRFYFEPEWNIKSREAQEWARRHYSNVVTDIETVLRTIK